MSIYRIKKDQNYVVMSRTALNDERLSWKAKGLIAYMLSMPDDWKFYVQELSKHAKDGEDSLRSGLKELSECGYLKRFPVKNQDTQKIVSWETHVFENPHRDFPDVEKPDVEKPDVEKPHVENPTLLSTDELNTDLPSTDVNAASADVTQKSVLLAQEFARLKGGLHYSPDDLDAAKEIIHYGIPVKQALHYMRESFNRFVPKHPKDKINSLSYCSPHIFDRYVAETDRKAGEKRDQKHGRRHEQAERKDRITGPGRYVPGAK